jgi:hypothetical protein
MKRLIWLALFSLVACNKMPPMTWNDIAIKKNETLFPLVLAVGTKAYQSNVEGNKDLIIFLSPPRFRHKYDIYIYSHMYFNSFGFDVIIPDYSPKDSLHYTIDEMSAKVVACVEQMKSKYDSDRIVIYGKDRACVVAARAANQTTVRGIVLENATKDFFDELVTEVKKQTSPILLLHGTLPGAGDWHDSVLLFDILLKRDDLERGPHLSLFSGPDLNHYMDNMAADNIYEFYPTIAGVRDLVTYPDF